MTPQLRVAGIRDAIRHGHQRCIESLPSVHMGRLLQRRWRAELDGHAAAGLGHWRRIRLGERGSGEACKCCTRMTGRGLQRMCGYLQGCATGHMCWKLAPNASCAPQQPLRGLPKASPQSVAQRISTPWARPTWRKPPVLWLWLWLWFWLSAHPVPISRAQRSIR